MKNLKRMKWMLLLSLAVCFLFAGCQQPFLEEQDESQLLLKKGKPTGSDTDLGDLYGDLWVIKRDARGVPDTVSLSYRVEVQDVVKTGKIDVMIPFLLDSVKTEEGTVMVDEGGGFPEKGDVPLLYDDEGELYDVVSAKVKDVEMGRLNLIRSGPSVLDNRLEEAIKNFGDGSVAAVIRDYCGRLFMVRTGDAIEEGVLDKAVDSPLENLAMYRELITNGFGGRLDFLVDHYNLKSYLDVDGGISEPKAYGEIGNRPDKEQFLANICAALVAAGSDKTGTLTMDELCYLNRNMGLPGEDCFFETIELPIRRLNKTTKDPETVILKFVDMSSFYYNREKFKNTMLWLRTIEFDEATGQYVEILSDNQYRLDDILSGAETDLEDLLNSYRYTIQDLTSEEHLNMVGFTNQADDYVQALELIHGNEEFLVWDSGITNEMRASDPYDYTPTEDESHGRKPGGRGEDSSDNFSGRRGGSGSTAINKGSRRGRRR